MCTSTKDNEHTQIDSLGVEGLGAVRGQISDSRIACPIGVLTFHCISYLNTCETFHLYGTKLSLRYFLNAGGNLIDISTSIWALGSVCLAVIEKDEALIQNKSDISFEIDHDEDSSRLTTIRSVIDLSDSLYSHVIYRPWSFLDNTGLEMSIVLWRGRVLSLIKSEQAKKWGNLLSELRTQKSDSIAVACLLATCLLLELSVAPTHLTALSVALNKSILASNNNTIKTNRMRQTNTLGSSLFLLVASIRVAAWRYFSWGEPALHITNRHRLGHTSYNGMSQNTSGERSTTTSNVNPDNISDTFETLVYEYLHSRNYTSIDIVYYTYVHGLVTEGYDKIFFASLILSGVEFFIVISDDDDIYQTCQMFSFGGLGDTINDQQITHIVPRFLCLRSEPVNLEEINPFTYQDATVRGKVMPSLRLLHMGIPHVWTDYDIIFIRDPTLYIQELRNSYEAQTLPVSLLVTEHWDSRSINNGFYFIEPAAIDWFEYYIDTLIKNPVSHDQNLFDALLRHSLFPYEPGVGKAPYIRYGLFDLNLISSASGFNLQLFKRNKFIFSVINRRQLKMHARYSISSNTNTSSHITKNSYIANYPLVYHLHGTATDVKIRRMTYLSTLGYMVEDLNRIEKWAVLNKYAIQDIITIINTSAHICISLTNLTNFKGELTRRFFKVLLEFVSDCIETSNYTYPFQPEMKVISISGVMAGDLLSSNDYAGIYGMTELILYTIVENDIGTITSIND